MSCMFFNKPMMEDMGTNPDDFYQLVLDGDWNYELFNQYCTDAYRDVNGDSTYDENDVYGCYIRTNTAPDHFTYTANNIMTTRDSDGIPSLNVNNEHFVNYMQDLYDLYYNNVGVYVTDDESQMINRFAEDGSLFLVNRFVAANSLREMNSEYGIVPFPKYDETQEYSALVHDAAAIFAIPVTVSHYDEVSASLEALCAESYRTVVPAYYEMALKTKYMSDSTSGIIIDMIKNAAKTDFVYAYNYALNGAGMISRTMMTSKTPDFASNWAGIQGGAEKGLTELIELYEQLDG